MKRFTSFGLATMLLLLVTGCEQKTPPPATESTSVVSQRVFQVRGVVVELETNGTTVRIKHEEIPDYMQAMTMPFEVKNTNELTGLVPGDPVAFRMVVTEDDGWIEQIAKRNEPRTNAPPTTGPFRLVRDVEPLDEGDVLPEYHFVNQLGKRFSTEDYRGQALAITFLFTRCPFPTFCPLMAKNLAAAQQKLLAMPDAPTNWHLLAITIDPEFDKPPVLKTYAATHGYQPEWWTFATGELIDITAIADQLGLQFWRETDGGLSHNLRTAVIDPSGRVQKILIGNEWSSDELVEAIVTATRRKNEGN